jgi:small-conductance mechanosensitive channel
MTITDFLSIQMHHGISTLIGPAGDRYVLGWLTWADLIVIVVALALAALCNLELELYSRRERHAAAAAATQTRHHIATALGRPLAALIWVYCVYLAIAPILGKLIPRGGGATVRRAMDTGFNLLACAAVWWFLFRITRGVEARLRLWTHASRNSSEALLVSLLGSALRVVVTAAALITGISLLGLPVQWAPAMRTINSMVLIVSMAVLLSRTVNTLRLLILSRFDTTVADNLRARQVNTQLHIISRIIYIAIGFFAVAAILMLFPSVRHVGTSLLASAGIAGVIAGIAAQKVLGNLLAGVQIAFAQTIREDDVLVVEGEWGRVEAITLSYVVVHIWDDRRLVLPVSYFIEKPFQNWTRTSAALTGSVLLWVDYSFDVEAARAALKPIIEGSPLWDKRFWNLQVSDASERCMQVRVLATSADSSRSWDLRCEIREKLLAYIHRTYPGTLPHFRAEIGGTAAVPGQLTPATSSGSLPAKDRAV